MTRTSLIAITILLLTASAFADGHPPPPPAGGPGGDAILAEYLDLTTPQREAWKSIQQNLHPTIESLRAQQNAPQIRAIDEQIKAAHDSAHDEFSALLTPDQRIKYDAFEAALRFLHDRRPRQRP